MGTNLVHVLTIIGCAAAEVEAACDELLLRRVGRDPDSYGSDDWTDQDHRDLAKLCETLIGAAHHLPVLYSDRYLDGWSSGGLQLDLLGWPDSRRRVICGDGFDLAFYPSRDREAFLMRIKNGRRTKPYREQLERRWHLDRLKEAIESASWLDAPSLVVSINQLLGPTRFDEEIAAALRTPIGLAGPTG